MNRSKIILVCGHTDVRRGIDGLPGLLVERLGLEVCDLNSLFIFCGRKKDRFKILYWEKTGFNILSKRFENGRLKWPNGVMEEYLELNARQFKWLLEGLPINQPRAVKEVEQVSII